MSNIPIGRLQIKPGETPDELVDHLRVLANRCSFPTFEGNGTKCPIPSSPCPHRQWTGQEIAHSWPQGHNCQDAWNMQHSHSLSRQPQCYGPQIQNCQCCQQMELMTAVSPITTQKTLNPQNQHTCEICTKSHTSGRASYPAKDCTCQLCDRTGTGMSDAKGPLVNRRIQTRSHPDVGPKV